MAGEIFGKQMDQYLAREFRRQALVEQESLVWLQLHETLEASTRGLLGCAGAASSAGSGGGSAARCSRGYLAGWAFLDELYGLCFCASLELRGRGLYARISTFKRECECASIRRVPTYFPTGKLQFRKAHGSLAKASIPLDTASPSAHHRAKPGFPIPEYLASRRPRVD